MEKQGDASMKMLPQPQEEASASAEKGTCIYYLPNTDLGNETVPEAQVAWHFSGHFSLPADRDYGLHTEGQKCPVMANRQNH